MKYLIFISICGAFCTQGFCESDLPRFINNENLKSYQAFSRETLPANNYSLEQLMEQLTSSVEQDHVARTAMNLFMQCKYFHMLDYCEDNLNEM